MQYMGSKKLIGMVFRVAQLPSDFLVTLQGESIWKGEGGTTVSRQIVGKFISPTKAQGIKGLRLRLEAKD